MKQHYTPAPVKSTKPMTSSEMEAMVGVAVVIMAYGIVAAGAFKYGGQYFGETQGTLLAVAAAGLLFKPVFKTVKALIASFNN